MSLFLFNLTVEFFWSMTDLCFSQRPDADGVEYHANSRAGGLEAHLAACCGERQGEQGGGSESFPSGGGAPRVGC